MTLEEALRERMPEASRRTLKQLVEHGRVKVDGVVVRRLDLALRGRPAIEISARGAAEQPARPLPPGVKIVYEDETVVVVEKPAGLLTIATDKEKRRTLYAALREHVKSESPAAKLFIVHRLDRDTSGLLVFAKSGEAKDVMQDAFAARQVDRTYTAVVEGLVKDDQGTLTSYLVESSALKVHVTKDRKKGAEAITKFKVVHRGRKHTLVEIDLVTGRKAQIRVQFADAGHPVSGDRVYGTATNMVARLMLHASRLAFDHPVKKRRMIFRSRAPKEFSGLVRED